MGTKTSSCLKSKILFSFFRNYIHVTLLEAPGCLLEKKKWYHELHNFSITLVQTSSDKNTSFPKKVYLCITVYTHMDLFGFILWIYLNSTAIYFVTPNCFLLEQQFT